MKTSLSHLPPEKQEQLAFVKKVILEHIEATEMIILFGSYSTGRWVEDKYVEDGITYEYISDFDILVVTTNAKATRLHWKWDKVKAIIAGNPWITRTKIISHSIGFLNEHIRDNYYFFTDIFKEGILLYDSGKYVLSSPQPLSSKKRKQKA
ncbi:MAG: nucleotidyltransferase domain-containing protein [Cytophagales bacterium]|nr:nucleotidyltransferase domain-containing protein [Cytophagales bacterium]